MPHANVCRSALEMFPPEIFFEIFGYLSIQELHRSFHNLDDCLTSILTSYSNIPCVLTVYQYLEGIAIDFFSSRITRLTIHSRYLIDLSMFPALHAIRVLGNPHRDQAFSLKFLSNLERISIAHSTQWNNKHWIQLSTDVMTNSFPRLRLCQMGEVRCTAQHSWKPLLSLRSLTVSIRDPTVYRQLLHFCPTLHRLKLTLEFFTKQPSSVCSSHLRLHQFELCLILRSVSLIDILDFLLSPLPNLLHLTINGPNHYAKYLDVPSVGLVLHTHVPLLTQFQLQMVIDQTSSVKLQRDISSDLSQFHPLFMRTVLHRQSFHTPVKVIISSRENVERGM